jgi:hypothetical protein
MESISDRRGGNLVGGGAEGGITSREEIAWKPIGQQRGEKLWKRAGPFRRDFRGLGEGGKEEENSRIGKLEGEGEPL